jgi:hypothetical protein
MSDMKIDQDSDDQFEAETNNYILNAHKKDQMMKGKSHLNKNGREDNE